jgi:tetratricopeptide (TPR) repeat protein
VKAALGRNPQDPKLYFLLIESLNAADDETVALAVCEDAVRRFPDSGKAHLAKGQQLARLGKYQEAGPSFERAIELLPQNIEPILGLAEVQNKAGRYEASLASYRQVLGFETENLAADLGASRDLVALGRFPEARDLLEKASSAHQANPQIHIELARVYARLGARDLAMEQTRISQRLREEETKQVTPR